MGTDIEVLVAGNCLLSKSEQNPALRTNYSQAFEPD
jgi:carbamoyltransferase